MPKDYAHKDGGGRQTAGGGMPGWVWLLVGVALGFAGAVGYYISRPAQVEAALEKVAEKKAEKKKIEIPPKEKSRFDFYDILPNAKVIVPKETPRSEQRITVEPSEAAHGRFLIQVGAFRDRKEAEQQKANLALLGIESRIEKVSSDIEQVYYKVRIGPETDQRRVDNILARLSENGIEALVVMVPE
jgi:cell division protein FtsN